MKMQLTLHSRDDEDDNSWEKTSLKLKMKLMVMGIVSCYLTLKIVRVRGCCLKSKSELCVISENLR